MDGFNGALQVFLIVMCGYLVYGYPEGGPHSTCSGLYPHHYGALAQTSKAPFEIEVSSDNYSPGGTIKIVLKGLQGHSFKGFIVVANRLQGDTEELVGNFLKLTPESKPRYWYPQKDDYANCVTQSESNGKTEIDLEWQAPDFTVGDIVFQASFVESLSVFWVLVKSPTIKANIQPTQGLTNSSISEIFGDLELEGECGITKGCMLYPSYCKGSECSYVVTYKATVEGVEFEMMGRTHGYVSLGLSEDKLMGKDETVTCAMRDEFVTVQLGYNPAQYNHRHRNVVLSHIQTKREGENIYCRWLQPDVTTVTEIESVDNDHDHDGSDQGDDQVTDTPRIKAKKVPFDLHEKKWYMQLAWGPLYPGTDGIGKHKELPLVSWQKVDVRDNTVVRAGALPLEIKIHATLAVLAWMTFAGLGMVIARFYRNGFKTKGTWFKVHRLIMLLVVALTVASFILIFVHVKAWTQKAQIHGALGIATTALILLQTLGGIGRPNPQGNFRPIFNWLHRICGKIGHILAVVTMMMALFIDFVHAQLKLWLLIVFAVWICVQLLWELVVFELFMCIQARRNRSHDVSTMSRSKSDSMIMQEDERSEKNGHGIGTAIVLYFLTMIILSAVSIVFIFLF